MKQWGIAGLLLLVAVGGLFLFIHEPVRPPLPEGTRIDRILVEKSAHRLTLLAAGKAVRTYDVALGRGGPGNKERQGDGKVPEGVYPVVWHNPNSAFHLSLKLGYPTRAQAAAAKAKGIDPGGDIMIHGIRNGLGWIGRKHRKSDWTAGCIAVTDPEIEEIWRVVADGTPVEIRP